MERHSIDEIVRRQKDFFKRSAPFDSAHRIGQLDILRNGVKSYEKKILAALKADLNKPAFEAYASEVGIVLDELRFIRKRLKKWMRPERVRTNLINQPGKSVILHEPYGVVLIIAPWNYPFQLLISPLIGALAAGNCAVVKPSEMAVNTASVVCEMVDRCFDSRMAAAVDGGIETSRYLLETRWDFVFFTGSSSVGKIVMSRCAEHLIPHVLELGGKSPAVVTADADINSAARKIAWGKCINAGQTCVAPDYLLVHQSVKERVVERIRHHIRQFYGGSPHTAEAYPSIINQRHFDRLTALMKCGGILWGGETDPEKRVISPTLMDGVEFADDIMKEEIFGPLLPVLTFEKISGAVEMIEKNPSPLALYIFTGNRQAASYLLGKVKAGGVTVNDTIMHLTNPHLPFGGVGNSGMGKYHGRESFKVFSNRKSVLVKRFFDNPLRYPPYKNKLRILRRIMR